VNVARLAIVAGIVAACCATLSHARNAAADADQRAVETLAAVGGLPAHIANQFEDPVGFAQARSGAYVVLDRRAHTVYTIDAKKTAATKVLEIGFEQGRVLQPAVLALSADDIFAVADAPSGMERIQYFTMRGSFLGGFYLQTRLAPRLVLGPLVLNGVGSMSFTGKTFLVSRPESGALFQELDTTGAVGRQVGTLRPTGHERDRELHLTMNAGLPLRDPTGGFYFVFQTGIPMFRKYDAGGTLLFERHIEGVELDAVIQTLPTTWPERKTAAGVYPIVPPLVRTAAVDPQGRLWISLVQPYTYVYDAHGEKIRTVQFRAASTLSPSSLSFTNDGRVLVTPGCYEFAAR
jgi:hypothetical protein